MKNIIEFKNIDMVSSERLALWSSNASRCKVRVGGLQLLENSSQYKSKEWVVLKG